LCFEGLSLKPIRVFRDITLKEVSRIFGPIVNRNGYGYMHNEDPDFIPKVKTLWMIVHQKPYVLTSRLIPLGMVRRLTFEKVHGKNMNWTLYAKWTNNEQH
jgi:hypothetical protein